MVLVGALPGAAVAEGTPATVRAEAVTRDIACNGGSAEVEGNRNTLNFRGSCRSLTLRGDANTIAIELAPGARIDVEGNGNRLRYTVARGGEPPSVRISGSATDLSPSGIGPAPAGGRSPVRLSGDNQNLDVDCTGRAVDIQGNRSHYTLRGGCRSLEVHGNVNTVRAELRPGANVEIEGNGTVLSYRVRGAGVEGQADAQGDARVTVRGTESRVTREDRLAFAAPPQAPAPPAPAAPPPRRETESEEMPASPAAPQASVPQLMHDLGATVVEAGTQVTFKADMLFDGTTELLHDDAPARLAALASLIARVNPSALRISGADPGDSDLASRRADEVAAWLKEHGTRQPVTTTTTAAAIPQVEILLAR